MKSISALAAVVLATQVAAQITISSSHLPVEGDTLVQLNCLLLEDTDLGATGPDYAWSFSESQLVTTGTQNSVPCLDVADSPFLYQFLFNNPFDPEYNADFAFGVDDIDLFGFVTFTDVYSYFQNNSDKYVAVGTGVTINNLPTPIQLDPVDVIYELPLAFGDNSSSYSEMSLDIPELAFYKMEQNRSNAVDGWGTLNLWGTSFDVLRVRTTLDITDSLFLSALSFGQSIDRPQTVEYKWLSQSFKVPVLQITTTGGIVTTVQVADFEGALEPTIAEAEMTGPRVFPVPAADVLLVSGVPAGTPVTVFDASGRAVMKSTLDHDLRLEVADLLPGTYMLVAAGSGLPRPVRFVKQ